MESLPAFAHAYWFVTLLVALLACFIVWVGGPLLGWGDVYPLELPEARLAVIAAVLLVWLAAVAVEAWRRHRRGRLLSEGIASASGDAEQASAAEIATLKSNLDEALARLRRGRGGRQALYELPWYVLIGPPGSGKTTALLNSGLRFPAAEGDGRTSVRGVGGTRNCDWWFADDAILLDTAGRYTTQDSDSKVDAAAWLGFLDLLKRARPRQPVNGALILISLPELAAADEEARSAHARAVRARLNQLNERLGVHLPVYVVFTKLDLASGFTEYFADLGKEPREQVWGVTFPLGGDGATPLERFAPEFEALLARLQERSIERLNAEPITDRRALIFGFPAQFAALKDPAAAFLEAVFQPSRFEPELHLRGVYFTSATQTGAPIDRLVASMAQSFGLTAAAAACGGGSGRSYFLTRLLREVVIGEAGLVGRDARVERRNRLRRLGAWGTAAAAVLLTAGVSAVSYLRNDALLGQAEAAAAEVRTLYEPPPRGASAGEMQRVLALLDHLRALPGGADRPEVVPVSMRFGLYQGDKLEPGALAAYRRALEQLFLPQMLIRLEQRLRDAGDRGELLYGGLKIYLMLGGQGPMDAALVREWMGMEWASAFPAAEAAGTRAGLVRHLNALLDGPPPRIPLDEALVRQTRATLARLTPAERAYAILQRSAEARKLPEWRVADHAGPAVGRVFTRRSGQPLTAGIPGLFTHAGFHRVFLRLLDRVAGEVEGEAWVLGVQPAAVTVGGKRLQDEVLALYYNDFTRQWDGVLADLSLARFTTMDEAAAVLVAATGALSPLRLLVQSVARETDLTTPPAGDEGQAQQGQGTGAGAAPERRLAALADQFAAPGAVRPGQPVSDRYQALRDLAVGRNGGPAGLDQVLGTLDALYQQVSRASGLPGPGDADSGAAIRLGQQLATAAGPLPEPVKSWLGGMGQQASTAAIGSLRAQIDEHWRSSVLPVCERVLRGRFPMQRGSRNDVAVDDFARLFAPNGLIDSFFNGTLRAHVDTAVQPWQWQSAGGLGLDIPAGVLVQFQRAAAIRDAFFPTGGARPDVRFTLTAMAVDPRVDKVEVNLEGQTLTFGAGGPKAANVQWPLPMGAASSTVTFLTADGSRLPARTTEGPWSAFRLFREARIEPRGPDRALVTFSAGEMQARFELRAGGNANPFTMRDLEAFQCPPSL